MALPGAAGGAQSAQMDAGFNFLLGQWSGINRRLKQRWVGSRDWEEFPETLRCTSFLGGLVTLEELHFPTKDWSGMSLNIFNTEKRQWASHWIGADSGALEAPLIGEFIGERGEFHGTDTDAGEPIQVRFIWTHETPRTARWEQAYSRDGRDWETNWIVELTRTK